LELELSPLNLVCGSGEPGGRMETLDLSQHGHANAYDVLEPELSLVDQSVV